MKFVVKTDEFRNAVSELNTILVPATTYRAISFILIKAIKDEGLVLQATDYEINLKKKIEANVIEEGSIGVPGKFLNLSLKDFETDEITLEQVGPETVILKSGGKSVNFVCLSENEYPVFPAFETKDSFILSSEVLKNDIKKTSYAVSKDTSNMILLGSLWEIDADNKKMTMVSTDSHRLVIKKSAVAFQKLPKNNLKLIVPDKLLNYLSTSLPQNDTPVTVAIPDKEGKIGFMYENTEILGKLIVGSFPDYTAIIPDEAGMSRIALPKNDVLRAIKFVSNLAEKKSYNANLNFAKDSLTVYTDLSEVGEAKDVVALEKNTHSIKIIFNINYIKDALSWFDEENVDMAFNDARSPILVSAPENKDYFTIIMPIRPLE